MKPLIIVTVFNRAKLTRETLNALEATTDLEKVEVAIVDNASTDGACEVAREFAGRHDSVYLHTLEENIGCPRALNLALREHRKSGQPVVKLDNDVVIETTGWLEKLQLLGEGGRVGMVSAYYDTVVKDRLERVMGNWRDQTLYLVRIVVGHCVWHSGTFMDRVGYFDVVHPDHLYGFEDVLLSLKARMEDWAMFVWEGWRIRNIQRWNALNDNKDSHVQAMRPHYEARRTALRTGGSLWTGPDGVPGDWG